MTKDEAIKAGELMIAWGKGEVEEVERCHHADSLKAWHAEPKPSWNWGEYYYRARPLSLRERVESLKNPDRTIYNTAIDDVLALIDEDEG